MALVKAETAQGFARLPAIRQIGLMIGLAASVALGVAIVLWSQNPVYSLLYGNLSSRDSAEILTALQQANIPYKVDQASGAIMVPAGKVHEARLKLAGKGLPKGGGVGFEILQQDQQMGTSQFVERARYQRALEVELARSIQTMRPVQSVRVHLAVPRRTAFIRKQATPKASVVLQLFPGHRLDRGQVASIVNLVAAAVPNLQPDKVTIVDQTGRLLAGLGDSRTSGVSVRQLEYVRSLEASFARRIEALLSPILGAGKVRAQVVADIDFTAVEKTRESYNPDLPALRSEQVIESRTKKRNQTAASGVPGTVTAKPADKKNAGKGNAGTVDHRKMIRNYELNKTISHVRIPGGRIRRLSIAVVLDNKTITNEDGEVQRKPLSKQELARYTALIKKAVGFDARRGDTISVTNSAFQIPKPPQPLPEPPIWEKPWVQNLIKQVIGALGVLFIVLFVLKPVMKSLAEKGSEQTVAEMTPEMLAQMAGEQGQAALPGGGAEGALEAPMNAEQQNQYDEQINRAKTLASQDPARVAQVVKTWVGSDA